MKKSKWAEFENPPKYRIMDLGRPAFFLIPAKKLNRKMGGKTVDRHLQEFLSSNFRGFRSGKPDSGAWVNDEQIIIEEKCKQYEVSFPGKKGIRLILEKLAEIAAVIGEDCIYFKAGQYSCLVYPPNSKRVPRR